METNKLDIVNLIENISVSSLTNVSTNYQSRFIDKIKEKFDTYEQMLFVASFYCYLNYKQDEYCIDLDDIWKWLGFSRKNECKKTLINNFINSEDYVIVKITDDIYERNFITGLPVTSFSLSKCDINNNLLTNTTKHGGSKKQKIMMKINTFKAFCLIVKTDKSKQIRNYYLKLEKILNEIVNEESNELRQQLQNQNIQIKEQKTIISKQKSRMQEISRKKAIKYEKLQSVYIGTDDNKKSKIGITKNRNTRETTYKTNNPDFEIIYIIACNNYLLIENIIKHILKKHTVKNTKEWFSIKPQQLKIILETIIYIVDDTMNINSIDNINTIFSKLHLLINTSEYNNEIVIKNNDTLLINDKALINKHFEESIYENFINKNCILCPNKESGQDLMNEFKNSLLDENNNKIGILYNKEIYSKKTHFFLSSFKNEFYENISKILNTTSIDYMYYNIKNERLYANGFNGIKIKNKPLLTIFDKTLYTDFFKNKLKQTDLKNNRIKSQDLLKLFIDFIKNNNINFDNKLVYGNDFSKSYGYNHHYKKEFISLFITYFKLKEQRIRFDTVNSYRGFYYIILI